MRPKDARRAGGFGMNKLKALLSEPEGTPVANSANSANQGGQIRKIRRIRNPSGRFDRLAALAGEMGIGGDLLEKFTTADLAWLADLPHAARVRFVEIQHENEQRAAGIVPDTHTEQAHCQRCGPVLLRPGLVAALDKVEGVPTAAACPWCVAGRLS